MPRSSTLDALLFPVEMRRVFVPVVAQDGQTRYAPIDGKLAVVDTEHNRVLGVVGRAYRLVSNQEAVDFAYECCRAVFPDTRPIEWEVNAADAPSTRGHCYIDLVHNSTALDFAFVAAKEKPDAFGPFIRVTNSYNGLRALTFDIGLYRKVCRNGLILPDSIIRLRYSHQRREIGHDIQFEVARERLGKLTAGFGERLRDLRSCLVGQSDFDRLVRHALGLRNPKSSPPATESEDWRAVRRHINDLSQRYIAELGENAYAVFNVVTEFASRPPVNRVVRRERHGFQRLAGAWLNKFCAECRTPGFELAKYLTQAEEKSSAKAD